MFNKFTENGKEYLIQVFDSSKSLREILRKFEYTSSKSAYNVLIKTLEYYNIDYSTKYQKKQNINTDFSKKAIEFYLTENSKITNSFIKKKLLRENLLEEKCYICNIEPFWNNKPLVLQLDHINGINDDNRLENLRFLCPNCHSQTETFSGKHKRKKRCLDCDAVIRSNSKRCVNCERKKMIENSKEIFEINPNDLQKLIWEMPMMKIAEIYNCSDKTIAKKIKKYNLNAPPRGYFIRK